MLIIGDSDTGKSKFLTRLKKGFPCQRYIQQNRSRFECDYSKEASYNFVRSHPCFVTVDDGVYTALLDNGDISDTKIWTEGGGKALQMKNM